jgi:hypothetical protein
MSLPTTSKFNTVRDALRAKKWTDKHVFAQFEWPSSRDVVQLSQLAPEPGVAIELVRGVWSEDIDYRWLWVAMGSADGKRERNQPSVQEYLMALIVVPPAALGVSSCAWTQFRVQCIRWLTRIWASGKESLGEGARSMGPLDLPGRLVAQGKERLRIALEAKRKEESSEEQWRMRVSDPDRTLLQQLADTLLFEWETAYKICPFCRPVHEAAGLALLTSLRMTQRPDTWVADLAQALNGRMPSILAVQVARGDRLAMDLATEWLLTVKLSRVDRLLLQDALRATTFPTEPCLSYARMAVALNVTRSEDEDDDCDKRLAPWCTSNTAVAKMVSSTDREQALIECAPPLPDAPSSLQNLLTGCANTECVGKKNKTVVRAPVWRTSSDGHTERYCSIKCRRKKGLD